MQPNLLILGGTADASVLAKQVAKLGINATLSYAGRVSTPKAQPIPTRSGGFGGVDGLVAYLTHNAITHLIDATHPFASQMSHSAVHASARTGVPLIALTRPPWTATDQDHWQTVPNINAAVNALDRPTKRIFLATGRTEIAAFTAQPQHFYLLRFVDAPTTAPPFPHHHVVVDRGPFTLDKDRHLLISHQIDLVVSKNSGGTGARAKLDAARHLGLPVLMIERPASPPRQEASTIDDVMSWIEAVQ